MRMLTFIFISICIHACVLFFEWTEAQVDKEPEVSVRMGASILNISLPKLAPPKAEPEKTAQIKEQINDKSDPAQEDQGQTKEQDPEMSDGGDEGAISQAAMKGQSKPEYPMISRRRGEEGTVVILVNISAEGKCAAVKVITSSGHLRLDNAAVSWARKAKYTAGKKGEAFVKSEMRIRVPFLLTRKNRR